MEVVVGLGEGLEDLEVVVGLGEGLEDLVLVGVGLGPAVLVLVGAGVALLVAVALAVALGLLVALADAVAVAGAVAVAESLVLAEAEGELLDLALLALAFGVLDDETEAASRTIADLPDGTERTAEVVAGGWPHTLGADAPTALTSAAFTVLASAAVPPRRPMLEVTMAAPATMPNADDADRAEFMAAPSSP